MDKRKESEKIAKNESYLIHLSKIMFFSLSFAFPTLQLFIVTMVFVKSS